MSLMEFTTPFVLFVAGSVPVVAVLALSIFRETDERKKVEGVGVLGTFVVLCLLLMVRWFA